MASKNKNNIKNGVKDIGFIIMALIPIYNSMAFSRMAKVCNKKKNTILRFIALLLPLVLFVCFFIFASIHETVPPISDMPVEGDYVSYSMDEKSDEYNNAYNEYLEDLREWKEDPENAEKLEEQQALQDEANARNARAGALSATSFFIMLAAIIVLPVIALTEFSTYKKVLAEQETIGAVKNRISFDTVNSRPQNQIPSDDAAAQMYFGQNNGGFGGAPAAPVQPVNAEPVYPPVREEPVQEDNSEMLNINMATEEQIGSLPGLTIIDAKKAIAYRDKNGTFASAEEFLSVIGAKPHIVARISGMIYAGSGAEKPVQNVKRHLDL